MGQKVLVYDDVTERTVRSDKDPDLIGSTVIVGSGNNRADCVAVSDGVKTITVVFSSALPDTTYTVNANFQNDTDAEPLFQTVTVTNKTTLGFTAKWAFPVDTTNYNLCYTASPSGFSQASAVQSITSGTKTQSITGITPAFGNTSFVVTATFSNTVDAEPLFQPVTITSKTTSSFTARWNVNTDTSNYNLEWHVADITS